MSESTEISEQASRPRGLFYLLFRRQLPLESETSLFIFVNAMDYFATYWGLYTHVFRETNPIARWFLEGWGLTKGLLLYKLALVVLVCVISQIVATRKMQTARWLLIFSSLVIGGVVVYSIRLLLLHSYANA